MNNPSRFDTKRIRIHWLGALAAAHALGASACSSSPPAKMNPFDATTPDDGGGGDATPDSGPGTGLDATIDAPADATTESDADGGLSFNPDAAPPGSFCSLPGSVIWTDQGPMVVPGSDASAPDITWLQVPSGFCAHYFAAVKLHPEFVQGNLRQLKFAPNGDLFVSSPTTPTTGGATNGLSAVAVLPDDNHDGVADSVTPFLSGLPSTQGLMFANGSLYYQDGAILRRVAYQMGDRQPSAASEVVANLSNVHQDTLHWPKVFDMARDGTIYITNGGSQADACLSTWPVRGAVFKLNPDGSTSLVATGFRNPIAMRCETDQNVCLVVELALDYSEANGGREKLVPLRQGDSWGFPCCATRGLPYDGVTYADTDGAVPDCSAIPVESDAFIIGHTPFGVDFEPGRWPAPWTGRAFVTLHGVVGTFVGARVVGIALDPATGLPLHASELTPDGDAPTNMLDFATGWDDGRQDHGRPAPVAFAPDGRMFLGDDQRGAVIWIAPVGLMMPP